MFSIVKNQTIQECSRMERQVTEMYRQMSELEQVIRELRSLSQMDEPVARLRNQQNRLDYQHSVLEQMMQALDRSALSYIGCENKICDFSEQNFVVHRRQEVGVNDFTGVANVLSGM